MQFSELLTMLVELAEKHKDNLGAQSSEIMTTSAGAAGCKGGFRCTVYLDASGTVSSQAGLLKATDSGICLEFTIKSAPQNVEDSA